MITRTYLKSVLLASGVLVAVLGMVALGFWQLQRMQEKELRLANIQTQATKAPVDLTELDSFSDVAEDLPVRFFGRPDLQRILFLDNRIEQGKVGYEVLVPVAFNNGWVLVNYGWVEAGGQRQQLPEVAITQGGQMLTGLAAYPQINPLVTETAQPGADFPLLIQQLELPLLEELLSLRLAPFVVQLTQPASSQFVRNWNTLVMPPEKHLAYAVQWFALAIAATIVAFLVVFSKRSKHD